MEDKLKKLFDYQRFERNERLEKLISETESRYAKDLSDEELTYVNAAGEVEPGGLPGSHDSGTYDIKFDKDSARSILDGINKKINGGK